MNTITDTAHLSANENLIVNLLLRGNLLIQVDANTYEINNIPFSLWEVSGATTVLELEATNKKNKNVFVTPVSKQSIDYSRKAIFAISKKYSLEDDLTELKLQVHESGSMALMSVDQMSYLEELVRERAEQHEQNLQAISEPTVFEHNGIMIDSSRASDVDARNLLEY